jgi:hypothetical protein
VDSGHLTNFIGQPNFIGQLTNLVGHFPNATAQQSMALVWTWTNLFLYVLSVQ